VVTAPVDGHAYSVRMSSRDVAQGLAEFSSGGLMVRVGGVQGFILSPRKPIGLMMDAVYPSRPGHTKQDFTNKIRQ